MFSFRFVLFSLLLWLSVSPHDRICFLSVLPRGGSQAPAACVRLQSGSSRAASPIKAMAAEAEILSAPDKESRPSAPRTAVFSRVFDFFVNLLSFQIVGVVFLSILSTM